MSLLNCECSYCFAHSICQQSASHKIPVRNVSMVLFSPKCQYGIIQCNLQYMRLIHSCFECANCSLRTSRGSVNLLVFHCVLRMRLCVVVFVDSRIVTTAFLSPGNMKCSSNLSHRTFLTYLCMYAYIERSINEAKFPLLRKDVFKPQDILKGKQLKCISNQGPTKP